MRELRRGDAARLDPVDHRAQARRGALGCQEFLERLRVERLVAPHPVEGAQYVGDRSLGAQWIAMRDDHARIREDFEQRRQVGLMLGRLEQPVAARIPPLQQLEQPAIVRVCRPLVGSVEPCRVGRHLECRGEMLRAKAHPEGDSALVGYPRAQLMHGPEGRRDATWLGDQLVRARHARILAVGCCFRRRAGQHELPVRGRHELRILRQQLEQDRGARARQTCHEHRPIDHLVVDFRVGPVRGLDPQARLEKEQQVLSRPDAAEQVQVRFAIDRLEQYGEGFAPVVGAEVLEPGVADRRGDELTGLKRGDRTRVPRARVGEEGRQPFRTWRRLPVAGRARSFAHASAGYCEPGRRGSVERGRSPFQCQAATLPLFLARKGERPLECGFSMSDFIDDQGFRANVGIVLMRGDGEVLLGGRSDGRGWQFPQGGMQRDETPEEALYRELREEVGLQPDDVSVLGRTRDWLRYRLPQQYVRRRSRPLCIGQKQLWFLLRFLRGEDRLRFDVAAEPEFDRWKWVNYWSPVREVIHFKRDVYVRALEELGAHAFPEGPPARPQWWTDD